MKDFGLQKNIFQKKASDGIILFIPTKVNLTFMVVIKIRVWRNREKKLNSKHLEPTVKHECDPAIV